MTAFKPAAFIAFCLLLLSVSHQASAEDHKLFNAEKITLENGLDVIAIPNPRAPVITQMVWYKVGAADEDVEVSGMAHYLEHLMFKGSENVPSGEFSKIIRSLGGNDNAFTSQDATAYFQNIARTYLETAMRMEADRMNGIKVSEEDAAHELKVVFEERAKRLENNPGAQLGVQMDAALYPEHPYSTPVIGWRDDLESFDLEKAMRFYERFYAPDNARLIVAGDITMEELEPLAKKYYGKISKQANVKRNVIMSEIPEMTTTTSVKLADPQVRQETYFRSYRAPSWVSDNKSALALSVLQEMLAGGSDAPFYQELVVEKQVASSVSLSYELFSLGPSEISIAAYPKDGVSLDELTGAIDAFIEKYSGYIWSEKELENAITKMQDRSVFARDSVSGPAFIVGQALATGMSLEEVETYPALLDGVTLEQVNAVMTEWFSPTHNYVEGKLLPAPKIAAEKQETQASKDETKEEGAADDE